MLFCVGLTEFAQQWDVGNVGEVKGLATAGQFSRALLFFRGERLIVAGVLKVLVGIFTVVAVGLLERSWMLFGTERGLVYGSCDFNLGLPGWFALDQWIPPLFE